MEADESVCKAIVNSQLFEVLLAITKLQGDIHKGSVECAESALKAAAKFGLAQAVDS